MENRSRLWRLARLAWPPLVLLLLALNAAVIPYYYALLTSICSGHAPCIADVQLQPIDLRLLHQYGLTPSFRAIYEICLEMGESILFTLLGALLFWRNASNRMALLCAYMLTFFGCVIIPSGLQYVPETISLLIYILYVALNICGQLMFILFMALFPSGRLVPRWILWACPPYALVLALNYATSSIYQGATQPTLLFTIPTFLPLLLVVGGQIYRYRRVSTFRERQQTKWVLFGIALAILGLITIVILGNLILSPEVINSGVTWTFGLNTILGLLFLLIPLSLVIAITRSQLYDIDTLINRSLVYLLLTSLLIGIYTGLVFGLESLLSWLTGQTSQPVVIVISTLTIAVLFRPLLRGMQAVIDRRFYRQKYDAARTLASFGSSLHAEIDLAQLSDHLLNIVNKTIQPATLSLWLFQPETRQSPEAEEAGAESVAD